MQGLRMQEQQVTLTDRDCRFDEPGDVLLPVTQCTEYELQAAIQAGALTPDQCMFMHASRMSWQVEVRS